MYKKKQKKWARRWNEEAEKAGEGDCLKNREPQMIGTELLMLAT